MIYTSLAADTMDDPLDLPVASDRQQKGLPMTRRVAQDPRAIHLQVRGNMLEIQLNSMDSFRVPVYRLGRLQEARKEELEDWRISEDGCAISWPRLGETHRLDFLLRRYERQQDRAQHQTR
ncbi:MAG: hypothetical protein KDC10_05620 [Calditrichaeota bacterium]|nr:hypothetical protein [Candidatus Cloacimonadota bacterium]MCA9786967.1 hypothetical protein [Candidatus Cloacimonadota bacterium]MCB1046662.1 hypothetical protein [Calditrichota bacterium]MCB9473061.1 hypothetical protein [Candidatus Delongbacteria bacterium]